MLSTPWLAAIEVPFCRKVGGHFTKQLTLTGDRNFQLWTYEQSTFFRG
ncbi:hypothetical protein [Piscirickettsia salmonis]|nr:hypothetical protein [Piscirickettsia salmonis]